MDAAEGNLAGLPNLGGDPTATNDEIAKVMAKNLSKITERNESNVSNKS